MSLNRGRKLKKLLTALVICGAFLFILQANTAFAYHSTSTYDKPANGTLSANEWNNLLFDNSGSRGLDNLFGDFVNTWLPAKMNGPLGIATSSPNDSGVMLDVNGAVRATEFIGPFNSAVAARNVSAGEFGFSQGGGNYTFGVNHLGNVGIGVAVPQYKFDVDGTMRVQLSEDTNSFLLRSGPDLATRFRIDNDAKNVLIQEDGGLVGIGTTTPNALLDVNGLIKMRTATIMATEDVINKGYLDAALQLATSSIITQVATSSFWQGSLTGNVWKVNTGNIGIGTTAPAGLLSLLQSGDTANDGIRMERVGASRATIALSAVTGNLEISRAATTIMSIGVANVGIGTTAPAAKLAVALNEANANTVNYLQFQNEAGGYADWAIAKIGSNDLSVINRGTLAGSDPVMTFQYVAGGGNVGIGATNPASKLEVRASSTGGLVFATIRNVDVTNSSSGAGIIFQPTTAGWGPSIYTDRGGKGADGGLYFGTTDSGGGNSYDANKLRMVITKLGNVGVGTTAPNDSFSIGDSGVAAPGGSSNTGHNYASTYLNSDNYALVNVGYAKSLINAATSSSALWGGTTGGNIWNLNTTGNVGVGTTGPAAKLDVRVNSTNNRGILFTDTNGDGTGFSQLTSYGGALFLNSSTGYFQLQADMIPSSTNALDLGSTSRYFDNSYLNNVFVSGSVGIGTTTPIAKLQVTTGNGGQATTPFLVNGAVNSGTFIDASGLTRTKASAVIGTYWGDTSGAALNIYTYTKDGALFVNGNGSVGIGTTAPNDVFSISTAGGAAAPAGSDRTGHNNASTYLSSDNYALVNYGIVKTLIDSATSSSALWGGTTGGNIWNLNTTGNVGVGTTNPLAKFYVTNTSQLTALNINMSGSTGSVTDTTYGAYILNNRGGGNNGPSRYGGYFEAQSYTSSSNLSYGVMGVANKIGGYGTSATGIFGIGRHTYTSYSTVATNLIGVQGQVDFTDDSIVLSNSGYGASLSTSANIPTNKTLSSYYGLYMNAPTGAGTITNKYAIYQADANSKNYFAGNIGIGTTAPNDIFSIGTSGGAAAPAGSDRTGHNNASTYLSSDNYALTNYGVVKSLIDAATSSSALWGGTTGGNIWNLNTTGNVGIGTTSPQAKLDILASNVALGASYATPGNLVIHTSDALGADIGGSISLGGKWAASLPSNISSFARLSGRKESAVDGAAGGYLAFEISRSDSPYISERMRITSTGNVGIGTTNPQFKLDLNLGTVSSNTNIGYNVFADATNNVGYSGYSLQLNNTSGNASGYMRLARTAGSVFVGMEIASQSVNGIRFLTHATTPVEAMRINAAGNVGIGTTAPNDVFSIGTSGGAAAPAGSDRTGHNNASTYLSSDNYALTNYGVVKSLISAATSSAALWSGVKNGNIWNGDAGVGNVGIGTTNPEGYKLNVLGNVKASGTIRSGDNLVLGVSAMDSIPALENYNDGYLRVGMNGGDGASYLLFDSWGSNDGYNAITAFTDYSIFNGNVGIGTTNASNRLVVSGADTLARFEVTGTSRGGVYIGNGGMFGGDEAGMYDMGGDQPMVVYDGQRDLLRLGSSIIDRAGSVGIGTTAPNDVFSISTAGGAAAPAGSDRTGHNNASTYLSSDNYALVNYGIVKTLINSATSSSALWGGTTGGNIWSLNNTNVGIGTTTPREKLEVIGSVRADTFIGSLNGSVIAENVTAGVFGTNYGGGTFSYGGYPSLLGGGSSVNMYLASTGSHTLHAPQLYVRQDDAETSIINTKVALDIHNDSGGQNTYSTLAFSSREAAGAGNSVALAGISGWKISAGTANAWSQGGLKFWVKDNGALNEAVTINQVGNVGIGTTNPLSKFHIRAGADQNFRINAGTSLEVQAVNDADSTYVPMTLRAGRFDFENGNVGIGTTNPGAFKLKVVGDVAITGALLTQTGSDFAEEFKAPVALEPGTVVVMGDEGYKSVKACENSYDKTVVGIVSDNPSIIAGRTDIDNKNPEKVIVAMMGVVKVKVADINGKIIKGDLLTTSDMKGYAMRAKNSKQGTIIGKALEDLNTKTGEIKVLVNLQ